MLRSFDLRFARPRKRAPKVQRVSRIIVAVKEIFPPQENCPEATMEVSSGSIFDFKERQPGFLVIRHEQDKYAVRVSKSFRSSRPWHWRPRRGHEDIMCSLHRSVIESAITFLIMISTHGNSGSQGASFAAHGPWVPWELWEL